MKEQRLEAASLSRCCRLYQVPLSLLRRQELVSRPQSEVLRESPQQQPLLRLQSLQRSLVMQYHRQVVMLQLHLLSKYF